MSSKRRIRYRSCESKVRHEDSGAAKAHMRRMKSGGYQVYRCKFCGGYHVGRRKGYKPFPIGKKRGAIER